MPLILKGCKRCGGDIIIKAGEMPTCLQCGREYPELATERPLDVYSSRSAMLGIHSVYATTTAKRAFIK